jgi:tetratricopeptide (TPR) repeat protein
MKPEPYAKIAGEYTGSPAMGFPGGGAMFLGREAETLQIQKLLREKSIVTLVGGGGVGKTRLALHAANQMRTEFPDGVFLIPLDSIISPEFVVEEIAMILGIRINPRLDPLEQFLSDLSTKTALLVFDNFENMLDETRFLKIILERAPSVKILVAARQPLNIEDETVVELHGLPFPDSDASDIESYASVQLFLQHARTHPDFEPDLDSIGYICRLADGIPLGIELAAAWASTLSCEQIAERIEQSLSLLAPDEEADEEQSLAAVFDAIWNLFSETEKRMLMGLSVFKGGFSRPAAAKITGASAFYHDALLDKRLIRRTKPERYALHISLAEYLKEKLEDNPVLATDMEIRHGSFYLGLLRDAESALRHVVPEDLLDDILSDADNIRIAWQRTVSAGNLRLVQSALTSWMIVLGNRGWFREAIQTLESLNTRLSEFSEDVPEAMLSYVQVKKFLGEFYYQIGDYQAGIRELQNGLERINGNNFPNEEAELYRLLGDNFIASGRYDESKEMYRHGLVLAEKLGNLPLVYQFTNGLGVEACLKADYQGAIPIIEHALEIARQLDDKGKVAQSLRDLGSLYYEIGDYPRAKTLVVEALNSLPEINSLVLKASILGTMGKIMTAEKEYKEACKTFSQGLGLFKRNADAPSVLEMLVDISELLDGMNEKPLTLTLAGLIADHSAASAEIKGKALRLREALHAAKVKPEARNWNPDQIRSIVGDVIQVLDQKSK